MNKKKFNILNVLVSPLTYGSAISSILSVVRNGRKAYVCVAAVHLIMECQNNKALLRGVNRSAMITTDGMPLVWLLKLAGYREIDRVYGPDLMLKLCDKVELSKLKIFLVGGARGEGSELKRKLKKMFPQLRIVGFFDTPIRPVPRSQNEKILNKINETKPDIIFVGLGCPLQERWMIDNIKNIDSGVMVGVGAAFDFITGREKQAPVWMRRSGLEWVFRLFHNPKRLWRRYLILNVSFVVRLLQTNLGSWLLMKLDSMPVLARMRGIIFKSRAVFRESTLQKVILGVILAFSIFIRLVNYGEFMWFSGDQGRDMIVATHKVTYGETINGGPISFYRMSHKKIINHPFYYNFLSLLASFRLTPELISIVYSVCGVIAVIMAYLVGTMIGSKITGLFTAAITAASDTMILQSRSIWQPHLSGIICFSAVYFGILSLKRPWWGYVVTMLYSVALLMHLSAVTILPLYLSWLGALFYRQLKIGEIKNFIIHLGLIMVLMPSFLTVIKLNNLDITSILAIASDTSDGRSVSNFISLLIESINHIVIISFGSDNNWLVWLFLLLTVDLCLFRYLVQLFRGKRTKFYLNKQILFIAVGVICGLGILTVAPLHGDEGYVQWYLFILLPFVYILSGWLLSIAYDKKICYLVLIMMMVVMGKHDYHKFNNIYYGLEEYSMSKHISMIILDDVNKKGLKSFDILISSWDKLPNTWNASAIWYFLEQVSGEKLVTLVDTSADSRNYRLIFPTVSDYYFVCKYKYYSYKSKYQECDRVISKYIHAQGWSRYSTDLVRADEKFSVKLIRKKI